MKKEIQSVIRNLETTLSGQPWFGGAVLEILHEVDESKVHRNPNDKVHSMLELLWHMNTWAEFCLKQLQNASQAEIKKYKLWIGASLIPKHIAGRKE